MKNVFIIIIPIILILLILIFIFRDSLFETTVSLPKKIDWYSYTISSDGSTIIVGCDSARIYISHDFGKRWHKIKPDDNFDGYYNIYATNEDGSNILICHSNSNTLYLSTNEGKKWHEIQPAIEQNNTDFFKWNYAIMSDDGKTIIVEAFNINKNLNKLYRTNDGGLTWKELRPAGILNTKFYNYSMSADGNTIIANVALNNQNGDESILCITHNGGKNWEKIMDRASKYDAIYLSGDGKVILSISYNKELYISTNNGNSWKKTGPTLYGGNYFRNAALNYDGKHILLGDAEGRLYISTNSGETWQENIVGKDISYCSVSNDGEIMSFVNIRESDSYEEDSQWSIELYISTDFGHNWKKLFYRLGLLE